MASLFLKYQGFVSHRKFLTLNYLFKTFCKKKKNYSSMLFFRETNHQSFAHRGIRAESTHRKTPALDFDSGLIIQFAVSEEIQFYRYSRNNFSQMSFLDTTEPYGPPLAIILPWKDLDRDILKKLIEVYCEKGFDVLTVSLTTEQFLYPCVVGNGMNVVTNLLEYLLQIHKHRPYIFHGFSIGTYIFGEIMAQCSDQYETFRTVMNNIKGCLWDSPIDFVTVKSYVGKYLYPKNLFNRFRCNMAIKHHFKKHYHDSVAYWLRSRDNFCNPIIKVPNIFFMSYSDLLSNPRSLEDVQKILECNGIPIFQKTWWDSQHARHFEKYFYDYLYGMVLFFNLSNLFPDENGKYRSSCANASVTNLRLRKVAKDSFV